MIRVVLHATDSGFHARPATRYFRLLARDDSEYRERHIEQALFDRYERALHEWRAVQHMLEEAFQRAP